MSTRCLLSEGYWGSIRTRPSSRLCLPSSCRSSRVESGTLPPRHAGVPLDDLFVIRHHQYLMIFIIDAVLELDFGEYFSQGLFLVVSLAKVLADETDDLKVRQSCPSQGYLRLVEDLQRRIAPDFHVQRIHSRFCHHLLDVDGVAHGDSLCKEPLCLVRADESVL